MIEQPAFTDLLLYFIQQTQAVSAMPVTYVPVPPHLTMLMQSCYISWMSINYSHAKWTELADVNCMTVAARYQLEYQD